MKALRDHYLRIDARSLGLFRILFGLVLIGDLLRRWAWSRDFYSNEGVLPNHNHLFNLKDQGRVWSALHAISTPGEVHVVFTLIFVVYALFLVGYKTRVFHLLSLLLLVSLTGRNILLENAGNYAAIALLAFTAFLPTGRRFSVDALRRSLAARDEKNALDLADRSDPTLPDPGASPTSLAALAVLLQVTVILVVSAMRQTGEPWRDGTALHYALQVDRWASGTGFAVRRAPAALLRFWTHFLYVAEWAVPLLVALPLFRRATRGSAALLLAIYGATLGMLFDFGLYGWSLLAAAPLLLGRDWWQAAAARAHDPRRILTVIYDADCGVCLWLARLLARLDLHHHVQLRGNDELTSATEAKQRYRIPSEVTPELADETLVVIDVAGRVHLRARAVAEVIAVLPLGRPISWLMRVPGLAHLLDALYRAIASRRHRLSVLLGFAQCGIPTGTTIATDGAPKEAAPAARLAGILRGSVREAAAAVVLAAMLVQTGRANPLPAALTLPQGSRTLEAVAAWPRMLGRWDMLAPAPPTEDSALVIDAQTKGGRSVDPLTGAEPDLTLVNRRARLGQLWSSYIDRIVDKEWDPYQKAFKDYLGKGGPAVDAKAGDNAITGYDAVWIVQPSPPPGAVEPPAEVQRKSLWTHSRGGRMGGDRMGGERLPALRPDARKLQPK